MSHENIDKITEHSIDQRLLREAEEDINKNKFNEEI